LIAGLLRWSSLFVGAHRQVIFTKLIIIGRAMKYLHQSVDVGYFSSISAVMIKALPKKPVSVRASFAAVSEICRGFTA
jgi:hypothetical protein